MSDATPIGVGGFIGSRLALRLAHVGHKVIAATRSPVTFDHPRIRNVVGSRDERSQFAKRLSPSSAPGAIAAQPQLDGYLRTILTIIRTVQDAGPRRLLFLSIGGTPCGDRTEPEREDDSLRPVLYHGASNMAAEYFIWAWTVQYVVLLRRSIFGPEQATRQGFGFIAAAFAYALSGRALVTLGEGRFGRDYLYIDDLVEAMRKALRSPLPAGVHACKVSSGTTLDFLDRIDRVMSKPLQRLAQPARRIDIRSIALANSWAKALFEWSPTAELEDGLQRTWSWCQWHA
jgi:nucleoside-diphosphate-sugar epimerase